MSARRAAHRRVLRRLLALGVLLSPLAGVPDAAADTQTALGDNNGEGSSQFTGLTQAPEAVLFTGAATTRVEIAVPPGHKGMTPALALQYSSTGGPSAFGHGWELPIGRIERSTKWGVPGCTGSHTNDFVLTLPSGSLELVNDPPGSDDYRPKLDEGFLLATRNAAANTWMVKDRGGMTYLLGSVGAHRAGTDTSAFLTQDGQGYCRFTTVWALDRIEDTHGNRINIYWQNIEGTLYPYEIRYGMNGSANHPYAVYFTYETRPDMPTSSRSGAPATVTQRVASISVVARHPTVQPVRGYYFAYDADEENEAYQSRLSRIEIDGNDWPQLFAYSGSLSGHAPPADLDSPAGYRALRSSADGEVRRTIMDVNADAIPDLVYYNGGQPWLVHPGFLDADGSAGGFSTASQVWDVSNVAGASSLKFIRAVNGCAASHTCTTRDTFDLTGDGVPDYVVATATPWIVHPGISGWGFGPGISWPAQHAYVRRAVEELDPVYGNFDTRTKQDTLDVNGDGRPDLVVAPGGSGSAPFDWQVYLNTGSGFATVPLPYFKAPSAYLAHRGGNGADSAVTRQMVDMDGDGLLDFLIARPDGTPALCRTDADGDGDLEPYNNCLDVYRGTGQGFAPVPQTFPLPTWDGVFGTAIQRSLGAEVWSDLFDVNGDGLPDLVTMGQDGAWWVFLNSGGELQSWGRAELWPGIVGPMRYHQQAGGGVVDDTLDMIDVNGDGMLDRVQSINGGQWTVQVNANAIKPNLLSVIRNGLNGTTTLRYQPSTIYQNTHLPTVTWVLDGFRQTDRLCAPPLQVDPYGVDNPCISSGHELVTELRYRNGLYDAEEREFRGFGLVYQIHRNDPAVGQRSDNVTLTTFLQDRLTKGKIERVDRYAGNVLNDPSVPLVASEANVWLTAGIGAPAAGRRQIYLSKAISARDYEVSGELSTAHAVVRELAKPDAYGNVDGIRTYDYDDGNCVATSTTFATPSAQQAARVYDKPMQTTTRYKATRSGTDPGTCGSGQTELLKKWFWYDGMASGAVGKGDVTKVRSKVSGSDNVEIDMQYDGFGNVTTTWDERDQPSTTIYDPLGLHAVLETNAAGHQRHTVIDYRWGKPQAVRDANDQFTCYGYDAAGRPKYVVRPLDSQADCVDADSSWKWETYRYGFAGSQAGDDYSWIEIRRREPGQPDQYLTTVQYFDALARPRYMTAPRVVDGDPAADCASEDPADEQMVVSGDTVYDAGGRVVATFDPYAAPFGSRDNGVTLTTYGLNSTPFIDPLGRPRTITRPDNGVAGGGRTTTRYYAAKVTTTFDAAGHKTLSRVDTYGRPVRAESYASPGDTTPYSFAETTYDGAGRVLRTRQNGNDHTTVTHTYDLLGRTLTTTDPDSGTWSYRYDPAGNLVYQDDPRTGQHVELCYDALNRPTGKFYYANDTQVSPACPGNPTIRYEYDDPADYYGRGRLARVHDRGGRVTYRYDARGRRRSEEREITLDGVTTRALLTYEYDAADRPWKVHYPGGEVVQTDYDRSGQPFALHGTSGSQSEEIIQCATYDLLGRPLRLQRGNGTVDRSAYHGAPGSGQFAHDHFLQRRQVQTADGALTYLDLEYAAYDPRGFLTRIVDHRHAGTAWSNDATYGYDFAGRLRTAGGAVNEAYDYDPLGNPTQIGAVALGYTVPARPHQVTTTTAGGALKFVQHDANGNRRAIDDGAQQYTFDADDRLVELTVSGPPFSRLAVGYDYGGRKLTEVASGARNLTTRYYSPLVETEDDGTTSYYLQYYLFGGQRVASRRTTATGWEQQPASAGQWLESHVRLAAGPMAQPALRVVLGAEGQMAALLGGGALALGVLLVPAGRRRGRRPGRRAGTALTLLWAVAAAAPWPVVLRPAPAEACCGGSLLLEWRQYHYDHLGSLQVVTNAAALNVENLRYTPYGQVRGRWRADGSDAPLGLVSRYEFTGHQSEPVSGLIDAGARYYDPRLGAFLSHDPARQFASPYSYVGGNPINAVDPTGAEALGLFLTLLGSFALGFAVSAIGAAAQGADAGAAFKAGAIGGLVGAFTGVGLGLVSQGITTGGLAATKALELGLSGAMTLYGIADSARTGNLVGLSAAVVGLAYSVSQAYVAFGQGRSSSSGQGGSTNLEQLDFAVEAYEQRIGEKVTVFVERPDVSAATKLDRKGLDGHSGMAIGEDFRDYGPQPGEGANLFGSRGRPWWDAFANPSGDASRSDIVNYIAAKGKSVDVYSRWVLPSQAAKVRSYWQNLYSNPGRYHFAGRQCTTTVADSLRGAGIIDFHAWKPTTLGNRLRGLGW